jgi:hypothetical protein
MAATGATAEPEATAEPDPAAGFDVFDPHARSPATPATITTHTSESFMPSSTTRRYFPNMIVMSNMKLRSMPVGGVA